MSTSQALYKGKGLYIFTYIYLLLQHNWDERDLSIWVQTNANLLVYDGSTINQNCWWVEPDKAHAPGIQCIHLVACRLWRGLYYLWSSTGDMAERHEICSDNIIITNVNANKSYHQRIIFYPVFPNVIHDVLSTSASLTTANQDITGWFNFGSVRTCDCTGSWGQVCIMVDCIQSV